jgi:hypothetical protein
MDAKKKKCVSGSQKGYVIFIGKERRRSIRSRLCIPELDGKRYALKT